MRLFPKKAYSDILILPLGVKWRDVDRRGVKDMLLAFKSPTFIRNPFTVVGGGDFSPSEQEIVPLGLFLYAIHWWGKP